MHTPDLVTPEHVDPERIARLEERIARLESQMSHALARPLPAVPPPPAALAPVFGARIDAGENFEVELGQNWFALAGIAVLTAGVGFLICLPYPTAPAGTASVAGLAVAAALMLFAHRFERSSARLAGFLSAAGTTLVGVASLRIFLFGPRPAVDVHTVPGSLLILAVLAASTFFTIRRRSAWLAAVALGVANAVALGVGTAPFILLTITATAVTTAILSRRDEWKALLPFTLVLVPLTYFAWAMGNPFRGSSPHFTATPAWAPALLLALAMGLGSVPLFRFGEHHENAATNGIALLNCLFGYGVFLVHTAAAFQSTFAVVHFGAGAAFVALAAVFFLRERSQVSTFLYAMTGYVALSLAIMKVSTIPSVFVWLALQSVVVVATAIWFRSRFIIVANFFIFALIIASYLFLGGRERGLSLTFGVVALATARILNWQQDRLTLKTELMRNAYLACAFCVFPYALHHLLPSQYVGLAWVGLASVYYGLNFIIRNQKYRWMGHGTLMLATVYVVAISVSRLEPMYRVLSFFALGALLLIVSLSFARMRRRPAPPVRTSGNGATDA